MNSEMVALNRRIHGILSAAYACGHVAGKENGDVAKGEMLVEQLAAELPSEFRSQLRGLLSLAFASGLVAAEDPGSSFVVEHSIDRLTWEAMEIIASGKTTNEEE